MAFTSWRQPKCTVKVLATKDILHGSINIESIQLPKEATAEERRIEETGVNFPPYVTHERSI
jgi:hypothetical protein